MRNQSRAASMDLAQALRRALAVLLVAGALALALAAFQALQSVVFAS